MALHEAMCDARRRRESDQSGPTKYTPSLQDTPPQNTRPRLAGRSRTLLPFTAAVQSAV